MPWGRDWEVVYVEFARLKYRSAVNVIMYYDAPHVVYM